MKSCEYCGVTEKDTKVHMTSRFGGNMILCNAHYNQMCKNGKLKPLTRKKNIIVEKDDVIEIYMHDKNGEVSGKTIVSKECKQLVENYHFYIYNSLDGLQYVVTHINSEDGKRVTRRLHILIAQHFIGERPEGMTVDHINRMTLDNRIENLRYATQTEQNINQGISKRNTSGVKGVGFSRRENMWRARLNYKGKTYGDKLFDNFEDAVKHRKELENMRDKGELD